VKDGFKYPMVAEVIRVSIKPSPVNTAAH